MGLDGPRILATRSVLYPDTEAAMGWGSARRPSVVLSPGVPTLVQDNAGRNVDEFRCPRARTVGHSRLDLPSRGSEDPQRSRRRLDLAHGELDVTWRCLRDVGNISSASALFVLRATLAEGKWSPGSAGLLIAMGPGFSSELFCCVKRVEDDERDSVFLLLAATAAERFAELAVSRRNMAWAWRGAEARRTEPLSVTRRSPRRSSRRRLGGSSLLSRPFLPWLGWPMLVLVLGAQALRWNVVRTLGPHWTTRVVVVPGHARIRSGPYRFVQHPNYLAVVGGILRSLVHTAWITAALFTSVNLPLLAWRIACEEKALRTAASVHA
jgi:methyltransferase